MNFPALVPSAGNHGARRALSVAPRPTLTMKTRHRAILKNQQDEKPAVKQVCNSCWGRGAVKENDPMCDRQNETFVTCKKCQGTGHLGALVALLLLLLCSADAATVTGTVRNRQGAVLSTNIVFKALQRPLFDFTPSVLPGWTLSTNTASDGTFSTPLLSGNYQVTVGGENRDSFIIEVPTNSGTYEITTLVTNLVAYTYTGGQTFTGFVAQVNGLVTPIQAFAIGTNGSGLSVSSSGSTHTFHLPFVSTNLDGILSASQYAALLANTNSGSSSAPSFDSTSGSGFDSQ